MTLHWWMHWFWVTSLIILHASLGTAAPTEETQQVSTEAPTEKPSAREGRAMYFTKTPPLTSIPPNTTDNHTEETPIDPTTEHTVPNTTEIQIHPSIVWTAINASDITQNDTVHENTTFAPKKRNLTRPDVIKDDITIEGAAESRIVTEKPLSLETTFLQTRIPNIEPSRRVVDDGMDTGAIAGISFAALVLVALAGSTAFVLYRRRYLNKPQTLNDKCSNPDSSGYLDDSTIRDNSEEMYSLDNDSFLNSLEAMTIQNYWTDTVKHTKL